MQNEMSFFSIEEERNQLGIVQESLDDHYQNNELKPKYFDFKQWCPKNNILNSDPSQTNRVPAFTYKVQKRDIMN